MEYQDAIKELYTRFGEGVFAKRFYARSYLADKIGSSPRDYRLLDLLYDLSALVDVVRLFREKGLAKGREDVTHYYPLLQRKFSKREFVDAINPLAALIVPEEYESCSPGKKPSSSGAEIVRVKKKENPKVYTVTPGDMGKVTVASHRSNTQYRPHIPHQGQAAQVQAASPKPKALRSLEIDCKSGFISLNKARSQTPEILINGKAMQLDMWALMNGTNKLSLQIPCSSYDRVEIYLPVRRYDAFHLAIGDAYLDANGLGLADKLFFRELVIKKGSGATFITAQAEHLEVTTVNGPLFVRGNYREIEANVGGGDLTMVLDPLGRSKILVKAAVNGKINGTFIGGGLVPPIGGFFHKCYYTDATCYIGNALVYFDMKATRGIRFS